MLRHIAGNLMFSNVQPFSAGFGILLYADTFEVALTHSKAAVTVTLPGSS